MTAPRPGVQLDLFDGLQAVSSPRRGKKIAPATATNSPGAVTRVSREAHANAQKCSGLLVRKQTGRK